MTSLEDSKLRRELVDIIKSGSFPLKPRESGIKSRIVPMKNIKAVIFDIYGTLFISASGDIGTAKDNSGSKLIMQAARNSGIVIKNNTPCENCGEFFYSIIKKHQEKLRKKGHLFPEVNIISVWKEFFSEKKDLFDSPVNYEMLVKTAVHFELLTNPVWPMPGLTEILSLLKKNSIPAGIISNAQFYTPLIFQALAGGSVEELGFRKELVEYSFEHLHAKPSSFMFDKVSQQLYNEMGIVANETLYVGNDMLNDIRTASGAGMKTVLFAGDKRSVRLRESECPGTVPDAVVTSLEQLGKVAAIN